MSERSDGGRVFPVANTGRFPAFTGMSLRDYFAAKAMQSWIHSDEMTDRDATPTDIAKLAYEQADAMLAEREDQS